jgi:hypothetical protein
MRETIDGRYSEVQCWSTVVIPPEINDQTNNPNEIYRHTTVTANTNPLPFFRRHIKTDSEAITPSLRQNRAMWALQMGLFGSWQYDCEFNTHSQNGAFFVSGTMIGINDSVHKISGSHYLATAQRSLTFREGLRTKCTARKPGLLDPTLTRLDIGGGARKAAGK